MVGTLQKLQFKNKLQYDFVNIKLIQHFVDPEYVLQNAEGYLYAIINYRVTNDVCKLLKVMPSFPIVDSNSLKSTVVYRPHSLNIHDQGSFISNLSKYCQVLPKHKDLALLDLITSQANENPDYNDIVDILNGKEHVIVKYCSNWIELAIGLILHKRLLPEQLTNVLINTKDNFPNDKLITRIGIPYLQILKNIFMLELDCVYFLSPCDSFLCKHIFAYLHKKGHINQVLYNDPDIEWRCITYLLQYREYKTALMIIANLHGIRGISLLLPKIPMSDSVFHLVLKFIGTYKEVLGFWYQAFAMYKYQQGILHDAIKYCNLARKYGKFAESDTLAAKITNVYFEDQYDNLNTLELKSLTELQDIDHFELLYYYQITNKLVIEYKDKEEIPIDVYRYMLKIFKLADTTQIQDTRLIIQLYFKVMEWTEKPKSLVFAAMSSSLKLKGGYRKQSLYCIMEHYAQSTETNLE